MSSLLLAVCKSHWWHSVLCHSRPSAPKPPPLLSAQYLQRKEGLPRREGMLPPALGGIGGSTLPTDPSPSWPATIPPFSLSRFAVFAKAGHSLP